MINGKAKSVFVSGPVTGIDYSRVVENFGNAEKELVERGFMVVNPTRLCTPDVSWFECMRICIKALLDCDGIYMLKGWKRSKGSRLEHFIALKIGMSVELQK